MFTLQVSFQTSHTDKYQFQERDFFEYLKKTEKLKPSSIPIKEAEIHLIFVNDEYIQSLNKQWRKKNTPTNVLSFFLYNPQISPLFGEIYISLETAKRQAQERKHTLQKEMNKLFVHGLLHLLGLDHKNDTEAQKMEALEKQILKS